MNITLEISKCKMKTFVTLYCVTVLAIQESHQKLVTYSECPCDMLEIPKDKRDEYGCLSIKYKDGNIIKSTWDCVNTTRRTFYCNQYKLQYSDLIDCSVSPYSAQKTNTTKKNSASTIKVKTPNASRKSNISIANTPAHEIQLNDIFNADLSDGVPIMADTPDKNPKGHIPILDTSDADPNDDNLTLIDFRFDDDLFEDITPTDAPETKPTSPSPTIRPTKKPKPTRRSSDSSTIKLNILLLVISFISTPFVTIML